MPYEDTVTTDSAFRRYEALRPRFPSATFPAGSQDCSGLVEIAEDFDAFILDSFGVLNVGERAIPGAADCLAELRRRGKRLIVLTNAASYTRPFALAKYHRLGFDFSLAEVVSSRDVATARLGDILGTGTWGAIAAPEDRFEDIPASVIHWTGQDVAGFLFLSSASLTSQQYDGLKRALVARPRPLVVANPDLVAPRETGLSKEPGFYAHRLADDLGVRPHFFGKPFGDAFHDAAVQLADVAPERIAMVGDTLHTDILGGRAFGARTVLVRDHGLFAGHDVGGYIAQSGIVPDFQCGSI